MKTVEILFEFLISDTGDKTYRVSSRQGESGENPKRFILHDSHFYDDAHLAMIKAIRAVRAEKPDRITAPKERL